MLPNHYDSIDNSYQNYKPWEYPVNPRYFSETRFHEYYTAGDAEQFQEKIQSVLLQLQDPQPQPESRQDPRVSVWQPVQSPEKTPISELFTDIESPNITTAETYDYISHTVSKGAYVEFRGGKLVTLLPFRNMNFYRQKQTEVIAKFHGENFREKINEILTDGDPRSSTESQRKYCLDPAEWRLNGPLIRFESPPKHSVSKFHAIENMLKTLAETRQIPDCAFFLNNRDYPILRKDGKEPNYFWFPGEPVEYFPTKFAAVLSMTSMKDYADIPYPHWDDWARVNALEGKYFRKSPNKDYSIGDLLPFESRKDTIVFRGGTTGAGVTVETNPRIGAMRYNGWRVYSDAVVRCGEATPDSLLDKTGVTVDFGITTPLNQRPRMTPEGVQTISEDIPVGNDEYISYSDQAKSKYILNIDGHVTAFRLSIELAMGSVIFLQENSPYSMWYKPYLQPYVHYVPVEYNLENLTEQIQWCINHQEKCAEISQNAQEFYRVFLSKDGILDFWQTLLYRLSTAQGQNRLVYPIEAKLHEYTSYSRLKPARYISVPETDITVSRLYQTFPRESHTTMAGLDCIREITNFQAELPRKEGRVTVSKHRYSDDPTAIVVKQRREEWWQTLNENFIGRNIVNGLIEVTPGFAWTLYNDSPSESTAMLNVPGESFADFLLTGSVEDSRQILGLIAMTLVTGQTLNGLCMNKLHPGDIILRRVSHREISFVGPDSKVYSTVTDVIPTLVDYTYARGWVNDPTTTGVYGYCNRYTPYFGLDMLSLAVESAKIFMDPAVGLSKFKEIFSGFVEIPDIEEIPHWVANTQAGIRRWLYATYMNTAVNVTDLLPEIGKTTNQLLTAAGTVLPELAPVETIPRFNTNGIPLVITAILSRGVNGIREPFRALYECGFIVNTMVNKAYLKSLVVYTAGSYIDTIRETSDPEFSSFVAELEKEYSSILRTCFVGQYLLGKNVLPNNRELNGNGKVSRGPGFINTVLVAKSLEENSPLKPIVERYLSRLIERQKIIATKAAMEWL